MSLGSMSICLMSRHLSDALHGLSAYLLSNKWPNFCFQREIEKSQNVKDLIEAFSNLKRLAQINRNIAILLGGSGSDWTQTLDFGLMKRVFYHCAALLG
jgi:hypothetical protein